MATLFERLSGAVPANATGSEAKIPIHGFVALFYGVLDGDITAAQAVAAMELDAAQTATAQALLAQVQSHPQKRQFLEWLFRRLVLAELGWLPEEYQSQAGFQARVLAELARAGA